jgi:bacteriocin-like protein
MSNVNAEPKPYHCELNEEELDRVSGGGTKAATKDPLPTESISLEYGGIIFSYSPQRT